MMKYTQWLGWWNEQKRNEEQEEEERPMLTKTASSRDQKSVSPGRMSGLMALCLTLILAVSASQLSASEGMDDLVQLLKAGVGEDLVLAYIDRSPVAYQPTAEEIVYLKDLGASDALVQALLKHGETLAPPVAETPAIPAAIEPAQEPPVSTAVVSAPPSDGVNVSYFYEALAPYGTWRSLDGAWVWQPTVALVDHAWRPYSARGRWINSDWGWAWHSDYSWGWAPFHYGRWSRNAAYGWVWTPDTVWGPAWVNWRTNDDYYGWAPLPPAAVYDVGLGFHFHGGNVGLDFDFGLGEQDFCFVPATHFCDPALTAYVLPPTRVGNVYKKTKLLKDNYAYSNHRIINNGPSPERVQTAYGHPIKQVQIVDANTTPGRPLRGEMMLKDKLSVFRPTVAPVATTTPPALIAKQELAKRPAANRIPAAAPQGAPQTRPNVQETTAGAQTARLEQARREIQAQQEKLAAERKAAAESARQTQMRQEALVTQRVSRTEAQPVAHEQTRPQAAAQREPVAAPTRAERAERPQPQEQPRVQPQQPVRPQPQEQPRVQPQQPVRPQPQEQPRAQVQQPVRRQAQELPRPQVQQAVRQQAQAQPRAQVQQAAHSQVQAQPQAQAQAPVRGQPQRHA